MDLIEQKAREAFEQIPFGSNGGDILSNNVVHSMNVEGTTAHLMLVIPKEQDRLGDKIALQIEQALLRIEGIEKVAFRYAQSAEAADKERVCGTEPQQAHYLQEYRHVILVASGKGGSENRLLPSISPWL